MTRKTQIAAAFGLAMTEFRESGYGGQGSGRPTGRQKRPTRAFSHYVHYITLENFYNTRVYFRPIAHFLIVFLVKLQKEKNSLIREFFVWIVTSLRFPQ